MTKIENKEPSPTVGELHIGASEFPLPEYFSAKGMMRDPDWLDSYVSIVLQWPKSCTISLVYTEIIALAKSIGLAWEIGILDHTHLALEAGATAEQITEATKVAAATVGLAYLDRAVKGQGTLSRLDTRSTRVLQNVKEYFGVIPPCFRRRMIIEDSEFLNDLVVVTLPTRDSRTDIIDPKLRAYVSLAAAVVIGWEDGVSMYGKAALRFGATKDEVRDVILSVFKTFVSNSMAAGFRTPCHLPRLDNYTTMLSKYVDNGALAKRKRDRLSS